MTGSDIPAAGKGAGARLTARERRLLIILGLPTFGLALAITTVSTYLPVVLQEFTSSTTVIGLIIGGEGLFALFLPLVIGSWSDGVETRFGRRLPFLIVAAPVAALALILMPLAPSLLAVAGLALLFFFAYFAFYPPYRALYPDLVPERMYGRAQSSQAIFRGVGLGVALVAGGVLLALWQPLPFVLAALALLAVTAVLLARVEEPRGGHGCCLPHGLRGTIQTVRDLLLGHRDIRSLLLANALWEFTLAALKSFVVLFLVVGLGQSLGVASLLIGVVAAASVVAAIVAGKLGDRYGLARVMRAALWVYGLGLLILFFTQSVLVVAPVIPFIALGGAIVMTLPYGLLMGMMPAESHGAATGLYGFSRGLGVVFGPLLTGVAIEVLRPSLESTQGYSAMFLVASAATLLSIPLMRKATMDERRPTRGLAPEAAPISGSVRAETQSRG